MLALSRTLPDMTRTIATTFVLMLSCLLIEPLSAQTDISSSGNGFREVCSSFIDKPQEQFSEVDWFRSGLCGGFLLGLRDGIGLAFSAVKKGDEGSVQDLGVCLPSGATNDQITRIVLKYITENPETAHEPTATLVVLATKKAFPCGNGVRK
jgi:hypothetical protein